MSPISLCFPACSSLKAFQKTYKFFLIAKRQKKDGYFLAAPVDSKKPGYWLKVSKTPLVAKQTVKSLTLAG
jgi:hypothetical protein